MVDKSEALEVSETFSQFVAQFSFALDPYQVEACQYLDQGLGVLVAAPTGAGKTVVGEYAVWLALCGNQKAFYTTPIKALSNQKYHDLCDKYGTENIGLLTGDQAINSQAPIVVMTTEVLRNMIYAKSTTLTGLGYVILDEVHYLADRSRGGVWEEVIIGLADSVTLIALSATVSNAEEFGDWLDEVRSGVKVVVSEKRPVPLYQHVLAGKTLYPLFDANQQTNPQLVKLAASEARFTRDDARRPRGRSGRGKRQVSYGSGRFGGAAKAYQDRFSKRNRLTPSRAQMVRSLAEANLLPAIVFVFSRAGCDGAVAQLVSADINLLRGDEAKKLAQIAEKHLAQMSTKDLAAVGYDRFFAGLMRGIAAHHAGLLPGFKAVIEEGFEAGLLKLVFATETLALGINMPAKSVVIEKLVKYNGQTHVDLTPGEYTQLTGRAGRRGIDVEGHAVVVWRAGMDPKAVGQLAGKRTYPLRSSFTPSYNMAVNMVQTVGRERARSLLEQSFAQYQIDRSVVAAARASSRDEQQIKYYLGKAVCELGDFPQYGQLREQISQLEAEQAKLRRQDSFAVVADSLAGLASGDVIWIPAGKHRGWGAVVHPGRLPEPNPLVMTAANQLVRLTFKDFPTPTEVVAKIRIPRKFDQRSKADRKKVHQNLGDRLNELDLVEPKTTKPAIPAQIAKQISQLRDTLRSHPCHQCPDREIHARYMEKAIRLTRDRDRMKRKADERQNTIGRKFERICGVLESLGYLASESSDEVTKQGRMLSRIYCNLDLVVAECIQADVFAGLSAPSLAAVLSTLVFESRSGDSRLVRMPDLASESAQSKVRKIWLDTGQVERDFRLDRPDPPDIGFAEAAFDWACGRDLGPILDETELPAGDFVRWVRQVIDLAAQIATGVGPSDLARTCREVVERMRRGIVDFEFE